jgi:membrane-associated phospholipid phosphatase
LSSNVGSYASRWSSVGAVTSPDTTSPDASSRFSFVFAGLYPLLCAALWCVGAWLLRRSSASLFDAVTPHTLDLPVVDVLAELGVVLLGILVLVAAWQARRHGVAAIARAASGAVGVCLAYGASEVVKLLVREDRPCRNLQSVADCPAVGDWSFPSNHTAIAWGAAALIMLLSAGRWSRWARSGVMALAAAVALARIAQGVHYPHDVLAGAAIGWFVTASAAIFLSPVAAALLHRVPRIDVFTSRR